MDERTIRRWFDVFKNGKDLVEIRVSGGGKRGMRSGYFTDVETLIQAIRPLDACSIYWTLNHLNDACYSREQRDKIIDYPKSTTSDNDVTGRDFVLIDIDPQRPADTNSTDKELADARAVGNKVFEFLRNEGFNAPICCMSGNGVHLLLKCSLANNPENTTLVKDFLAVLDMLFSTETVKVDTNVFNAGRICKLYGTYSRKGSPNDPTRPQRISGMSFVPDVYKENDKAYFEKVAAMLPKPESPNRLNGYSSEPFDLEQFISKHGIEIAKVSHFSGGVKYVLSHCPFDENHKAPDAALFRMSHGGIGFKCMHNSCSQYHWHDFRLLYEPDAYTKTDLYESRQKRDYYSKSPKKEVIVVPEDVTKGKKWLQMSDVRWVDPSNLPFVPTGIAELDKRIMGLMLGDVTVLSGLSGAGKTSIIDTFLLNVVDRGYHAAVWSGELQDFRFQSWIDQVAAGRNYVKPKPGYKNLYFAPQNVCEKINKWLDGKLWLYNNGAYGSKWGQLFADIKECVGKNNIQLVVLDNLMALDISEYQGEKNERQSLFINDVKEIAKRENIHDILVCHPRKEMSFQLLRMDSISGTADLTNLADNCIIIHRVGNDFEKRATAFWGAARVSEMMSYDAVIEVAKNRMFGVKDFALGLFYEQESRRLKESFAENVIYGWCDDVPDNYVSSLYEEEQEDDGDMPDFTNF